MEAYDTARVQAEKEQEIVKEWKPSMEPMLDANNTEQQPAEELLEITEQHVQPSTPSHPLPHETP